MAAPDRPADYGADRPSHWSADRDDHYHDHGDGGRWLSVGEAARALGITKDAVWGRIKRQTLPYRRGDGGRALVLVGTTDRPTASPSEPDHGADRPDDRAALMAELAGLRAERDGLRARLADKDAEIGRLSSIIERRDCEAERMQVLLQAEQQQVKALTDQRPRASWWRRWFGGSR